MSKQFQDQRMSHARRFFMPDLTVGFQSKFRTHYKRVRDAFIAMDEDRDGLVTMTEFRSLLDKFNMPYTERDMAQLYQYFDIDSSGGLTYSEFNDKVGFLIHEAETGGVGIQLQSQQNKLGKEFFATRPAKIKALSDKIAWNNNFRQTLCTPEPELEPTKSSHESNQVPLMSRLVEGKYYKEDHRVMPDGKSNDWESRMRPAKGQMWDHKRKRPLMNSVISYSFHSEAASQKSRRVRPDRTSHMVRNKKFLQLFSNGMSAARRNSKDSQQRGSSGTPMSMHAPGTIPRTSTPRSSYRGRATPTNGQEVMEMVGQKVDNGFGDRTAEWLSRASRQEKEQFKRVASYLKCTNATIDDSATRMSTARPSTAKASPAQPAMPRPEAQRRALSARGPRKDPFGNAHAQEENVPQTARSSSSKQPMSARGKGVSPRAKRLKGEAGVNVDMLRKAAWQMSKK